MIPQPIALHTAARRYLLQEHARWTARYAEIGGGRSGGYTKQDRDTFPRYQVASAMLEGVERLRPEEFSSLIEARERTLEAGVQAQTVFTDPPGGEIEARAMAEERSAFEHYLRTVSETELAHVEPLPYRRVLSDEEVERYWRGLRDAWAVDGYWYPLDESTRPDVIALQASYFHRDVEGVTLRRVLSLNGISHVYELREYGASYECALELLEVLYNGAEGFWFAPEEDGSVGDWLIYASHESSLTIGGAWLIDHVKAVWPEWKGHLWTTPFY